MESYVVDASIIIKWVLGDEREEDHSKALHLLNAWVEGRVEIAAPMIWQYIS
jgi:predicted nucleic acid-binding protein